MEHKPRRRGARPRAGSEGAAVAEVPGEHRWKPDAGNILGDAASFTSIDLSDSLGAYRTLLNYVDATVVNFRNTAPWADVLAPLATITGESGHIEGTVVAAGFNSQIELHMGRANYLNAPAQAVPVPGSLPLTALGLFALAWVRRSSGQSGRRGVKPLCAA